MKLKGCSHLEFSFLQLRITKNSHGPEFKCFFLLCPVLTSSEELHTRLYAASCWSNDIPQFIHQLCTFSLSCSALPAPRHEPRYPEAEIRHEVFFLNHHFWDQSLSHPLVPSQETFSQPISLQHHSPFSVSAPFQDFSSNPAVHLRAGITTCCREICRDQLSLEPVGSYSRW